jgi:hypothetical protein
MRSWSPYVVGALVGVLSWFAFVTADKPLGTSTTFVRSVGLVEQALVPAHVASNAYFEKTGIKVNWQMLLVVGIFAGAWLSGFLSGDREVERVPSLWKARFGPGVWKRYAFAFLGGALVLFGARLAGGCTSGHGISGSLQLAVSGWTFFLAVFAAGLATSLALFGKVRAHV